MNTPITLSVAGIMLNWLVEAGVEVKVGDVIAEIEADKATVEIEAPANGVLSSMTALPGDELAEGAVIGMIADDGADVEVDAPAEQETIEEKEVISAEPDAVAETEERELPQSDRLRISPLARKMADERGIDPSHVRGSGPGGRIVKADIENYQAPPAPPSKSIATGDDYEELAIGRMRKRIGEGTARSKREAPHFYVTVEIDVEMLLALRKQWNESHPSTYKLSVNDLLVKATALTLRKFPNLNTHYVDGKLYRHQRQNIGISVALEGGGLINVVASDADRRELGELAQANREMIQRAREGRIRPSDVQGATFTISNMGPYDVFEFSAIIDPPQAGILAVSSARRMAVVCEDGNLGVGTRMNLTLSVDHRVSDGAEAALFLQDLRQRLESPLNLFLSGQE